MIVAEAFQQQLAPLGGNLWLSAIAGLVPLIVVFVLLGVFKMKAYIAGLSGLLTAIIIAVVAYGMPTNLALLSAAEGGMFGLIPIMWIVIAALWVYGLTVISGRFEDLRRTFDTVSEDPRIQAMLIAFCFGGLLEALAGFGAPVAITATMLITMGVAPLRSACTVLLANTAPVAFGALAIPIVTAANLTDIPLRELGSVVGRQAPILAAVVPLLLLLILDGRRGLREAYPAALVTGVSFAIAQFISSNFISVELTDIVASLVGLGATVAFLKVWTPIGTEEARVRVARHEPEVAAALAANAAKGGGNGNSRSSGSGTTAVTVGEMPAEPRVTKAQVWMALFPYLLIIAAFSIVKLVKPVQTWIGGTDIVIPWPGLDGQVLGLSGKAIGTTVYKLPWLSGPGSILFLCGIVIAIVYGISASAAGRELVMTVVRLKWAILTVVSVLALSYVMNISGQTTTIGTWVAGTGALFAFLSPVLGWLGTAVTGSDTSANALFAKLQATAGANAGIDPTLLVAANTTGGVVGKMISPQNLTIAASSTGLDGQESIIFRRMIPWSLGLLLVLCTLVFLQSTPILGWMLP